jgi:hypothetical protein
MDDGKEYRRSPLSVTEMSPLVRAARDDNDCRVVESDIPAFAATSAYV